MKKRFLALSAALLWIAVMGFSQQNVIQPGSPTGVVAQLYKIYKTRNFRDALAITTGKEQDNIDKIISAMSNNFGKLPAHMEDFISKIDDIKFLDETIKDNIARVDVIWILKYRPKDSTSQVIKVNEVAYLLEKISDKWRIRSSKQLNQHTLYDVRKIQELYKRAYNYENEVKELDKKK